MRLLRSKVIVGLGATMTLLALYGCSTPPTLNMTDALQKLEDAGEPCLYPLFNGFEGLVETDQQMFCRDADNGEIGYKMAFFADKTGFKDAVSLVCESTGPNSALAAQVLRGENWLATSDEGSKYSLTDLKAILGGSEAKLADLCK